MLSFPRDIISRTIYITVAVYIATQIWQLVVLLMQWAGFRWEDLLALHSNLQDFLFTPWTLVTYMFCHANISQDIFHIIFNMLWLWWFGRLFLEYRTERQFVVFYLGSGIVAGLFYLLCYNVFPYFAIDRYNSTLVGASGAICALIAAVGMRLGERVIGLNLFVRVVYLKLKWLCLLLLVLCMLTPGNGGGAICHIGGILFGLIYGYYEKRPRLTVSRGGSRGPINADRKKDMDYNARQRERQARIDAILDKISKGGYDSLTEEEKRALFEASQRKK